jgi:hypothetical protein
MNESFSKGATFTRQMTPEPDFFHFFFSWAHCTMDTSDAPADFWLWNLIGILLSNAVVVAPAALVVRHYKANPEKMSGTLEG